MSLPNPILRFSDGSKIVDMLAPGSGWKMTPPYWNPQIPQYKRGGFKINPSIAEGQRLVHKEYDNVVETIPLSASGSDQNLTIATINELLSLSRQAADYWAESYEFDDVWMEVAPACEGALVGYARVSQMRIPELTNPFGQPFFASFNEAVMDGITLIVEREPLWRAVPPGQIIGPLYNLIRNPDFELWNFGVGDSQPDSWTDLETAGITGQNSRETVAPHSGLYSLKIAVTQSLAAGRAKGVTQVLSGTVSGIEYTVIAWVRSVGVSNGVGRILITYSSQFELYRSSTQHGWTLYTAKFTTGIGDVVAINCEILTTAANTVGTIYIDSLMLIRGDFEQYAIDGMLPYISSSHIVNHWDQAGEGLIEAGDINYVDVFDVPGNEDALVRVEIQNNTIPVSVTEPVEVIRNIRIGMRRTGNVLNFQNYHDPPGTTDTTASSDDRIPSGALTNAWRKVTDKIIKNNTIDNEGRFRVFIRIYDEKSSSPSNLQARLAYFIGTSDISLKILNAITSPIVGNWTVLNLTTNAAMNFDKKFSSSPPAQMGYQIQVQRSSGTEQARVDYVIVMPTDGGYIDATITPSIQFGNALIIDGTEGVTEVNATNKVTGFDDVYQTASEQYDLETYKDYLYIATGDGTLYRFKDGEGVSLLDYGANAIRALAVYNGLLHIAISDDVYTSDGDTFSLGSFAFTIAPFFAITAMKVFSGRLWVGGTIPADIYSWDGSSTSFSFSTGDTVVESFGTYGNRLYAGTSRSGGADAHIFAYDSVSNSWSTSFTPVAAETNAIYTLKEFGGKLYAGSNPSGILYVFDGQSWLKAHTFLTSELPAITSMEVIDDTLYISGTTGAGQQSPVFQTTDGVNFEKIYDASQKLAWRLKNYQGNLYIANRVFPSGTAFLTRISFNDDQYTIPNFSGVPFYSPPKKRHRFFFNWDRENFINNVDDTALIGIGFVPRYLALRGNR